MLPITKDVIRNIPETNKEEHKKNIPIKNKISPNLSKLIFFENNFELGIYS